MELGGGVCLLRKRGRAGGSRASERGPREKVQFGETVGSRGVLGFRGEKERKSVVKLSAEVAPIGCTRDSCLFFVRN